MSDEAALMGRPRKEVSPEGVRKLAQLHATNLEMAAFFNVSKATLQRRLQEPEFREAYEAGKAEANLSLKRAMFKRAIEGPSDRLLIWLSKQYLGMRDRVETVTTVQMASVDEAIGQIEEGLMGESRVIDVDAEVPFDAE